MKKGSIHYQIQEVFLKSGIFTPGLKKHEVKLQALEQGMHSWKDLGERYTIYSYKTADAYLAVWHQLGRYARLHFGLDSIHFLTSEHVGAYLSQKIDAGVAMSTFNVHAAAIMKLEKAFALQGLQICSFRPVVDTLTKEARTRLPSNHVPRAYVDPYGLIHSIPRECFRLVASLQYEGGARIREVALIKEIQLLGETEDILTGAVRGRVHLIHCKGGLQRDILVSLPTYATLVQTVERNQGLFRINPEVYRRSIVRAAHASYQDYTGTHGLRWNFAQKRFLSCRDHGLSQDQALKRVSAEMGHRRGSITLHYLLPTPY